MTLKITNTENQPATVPEGQAPADTTTEQTAQNAPESNQVLKPLELPADAPKPGSPEYDAYIAQLMASGGTPAATPEGDETGGQDEPQLIAGKFKTQDDLINAYKELEKKLATPQKKVESNPETAEFDKYVEEALSSETGALSEASYAELAKKGMPKAIVDRFIEGERALIQAEQAQVKSIAGGDQGYADLVNWARQNLSAEEIDLFNEQVSASKQSAILAVKYLVAERKSRSAPATAAGKPPAPVSGTAPRSASADLFKTQEEFLKAVQDKRYDTDDKYRQDVIRRAAGLLK